MVDHITPRSYYEKASGKNTDFEASFGRRPRFYTLYATLWSPFDQTESRDRKRPVFLNFIICPRSKVDITSPS